MNVQKLKKNLRFFVIIKHDFSSKTKKIFLCTCLVLDQDIKLKELELKFFEGVNGYVSYSMVYFLQTTKSLDVEVGSVKSSTKKKDLDIVMLHLFFSVHILLFMRLDYFSIYICENICFILT